MLKPLHRTKCDWSYW